MHKPTKTKNSGLTEILGSCAKQSFSSQTSKQYDFYISDEIGDASDYSDWLHTIRNARADDQITFHINSPGGSLFSTIQLIMAMNECEAHLRASVEGMCISAATLIFLECDEYVISPFSMFMFHDYSSGTCGKGGEMFDAINFERTWSENLFRKCYKFFLSEGEIDSLVNGKELWMGCDDVIKRLGARYAAYEALAKEEEKASKAAVKKTKKNDDDSN